MARTSKDSTPDEPASYEAAIAELESLVSAMEGGQMPLDRLLVSYRRGAELLDYCRARLKVLEDQVKVLDDGRSKDGTGA
jgi:exodeoxyribonuclease VII small subunit